MKIHTGATQLIDVLERKDVQSIFGYPGGAIMPIYDALYESDIDHYLCRHEQGAAFSAIGFARASTNVGVCMATSGPGATNLVTSLADALLDSIPIIAITGQVSSQLMGTDAFQEVDIIGMSLSCTKHSFLIKHVNEIPAVIDKAFKIATTGRAGPVLIDIPNDIQLQQVTQTVSALSESEPIAPLPIEILSEIKKRIAGAKKPILYVGGGVGMANSVSELRDFMTVTNIPSVSTLKGLGTIDELHSGYLGMLGMHGTKAANLAVQQCDLLIAVGARFDDRVTGKLDGFAPHAQVIHIDIDQSEIGKRRIADVALIGNLQNILPAISIKLDINNWKKACQNLKAEYAWRYDHSGDSIYAPAVLKHISDAITSDTVVITDVGQHQMWAAQHMSFTHPRNFISSGGLGAMGFGLPAAIGAQVSRPQDPVMVISGDGSLMMNIQELATIKRYQLPIKIVLFDNSKLGLVRQWQDLFFDGRQSETDLSDNPDFIMLAKSFGIMARVVSTKSEVQAAVEQMLNHSGAFLLRVKIDESDNVWPLVAPGSANEHMIDKN
ncbi:MAG: acetolactate synthase 2 catalytic subunit [Parashewanella sp.]